MRHQQYRDSLLERLRTWRVANPDAMIADARKELRSALKDSDVDLLFDNWLNVNFDRIEIRSMGANSHTAVIRSTALVRNETPAQRVEKRLAKDVLVSRMNKITKANLFESFASHIWETILPNGKLLREAKGKDLKHATGWYGQLAKMVKPTESLYKKFSTKQLFELSQRPV